MVTEVERDFRFLDVEVRHYITSPAGEVMNSALRSSWQMV